MKKNINIIKDKFKTYPLYKLTNLLKVFYD